MGAYKGVPTIWVEFDRGHLTAFAIEHAPLRTRTSDDPTTPVNPDESCDVCGERPVVLKIYGTTAAGGPHRYCDQHLPPRSPGWVQGEQ